LKISKIDISPIGVASVRGIFQGIHFLGKGDRYDNFSPIGVASVRGIFQGIHFLGKGDR